MGGLPTAREPVWSVGSQPPAAVWGGSQQGGAARVADRPAVPWPADVASQAMPASEDLGRSLEDIELQTIRRVLDAAGGNISVAAKRLGISRNTIYRKLRWNQKPE